MRGPWIPREMRVAPKLKDVAVGAGAEEACVVDQSVLKIRRIRMRVLGSMC